MRLIYAEKLVDMLYDNEFAMLCPLDEVSGVVDACPTVDAVVVTRCKDCKHFNRNSMECENEAVSTDHEGGAEYSLNFEPDDFCSYGERKDEGADND